MKNLKLSLLAASALALTACTSDEPFDAQGNGYQDGCVVFNVEMPGSFTRDIADGLKAEKLSYAVFNDQDVFLFQEEGAATFENRETTVKIPLVNGKTYKVAFFASSLDKSPYKLDGGKLKIDYSTKKDANDDNYDAFYTVDVVAVSKNMDQKTITLTRPFAQVNVGATDWAAAKKADFEVSQTTLTFTADVYTEMNLLDGTVVEDSKSPVEFNFAGLPDFKNGAPATLTVADEPYEHVAMAYVLVPADKTTVETVNFKYMGPANTEYPLAVNSVPVQRNHRTNIVGKFFTTDADYKIIIDQKFDNDDYVYSLGYEALKAAAAEGGNIRLGADVEIPQSLTIPAGKKLVVDLNGYDLTCNKAGQDVFCVFGELEINGNGNVIADGAGSNYAVWARSNSKVTINGGTYMGHGATIQGKDNAVIVINDGYFRVYAPYAGQYFVLNLQDNQPNTITVNGGFFENFDPADTKTEPTNPTSFLAADKKSVKVQSNPVVYKVVDADDTRAYALDSATLDEAANTPGAKIMLAGPVVELSGAATFAKDVTVSGEGAEVSTLKLVPVNNKGVVVKSTGVEFSDLTLDGTAVVSEAWSTAVNIEADGCEIKDCVVTGGGGHTNSSSVLVWKLKEGESFKISNSEVTGAFRGVYAQSQKGDIYVDNCVLAPQCYTINVDGGGNFGLYVTNTTLMGWTSFSNMTKGAHFTNCKFMKNTGKGSYGYNTFVSYCETTLTNCEFSADFVYYAGKADAGYTIRLNNCTIGGVKVTAENLKSLLTADPDPDMWNKCVCIVDGVTVAHD